MAVGGDITEISFNHPTLGSGFFFPKSAEDGTFDTGGFVNNDDANMIAGSGEPIYQMNRVRWSTEVTVLWDMLVRDDLQVAKNLAASPVEAEWTLSHINGAVYKGKGKPVGDLQGNTNAATFTLKLAGGGVLKKIL